MTRHNTSHTEKYNTSMGSHRQVSDTHIFF
jgi:hypothetical protein